MGTDPVAHYDKYVRDGNMDYKAYKACDKYVWKEGGSILLFEKDSSRLVAELGVSEGAVAAGEYEYVDEITQWAEMTPEPKLFDIATLEKQCGCKCVHSGSDIHESLRGI